MILSLAPGPDMERSAKPSTLKSILRQLCPRCRAGRMFSHSVFLVYLEGLPQMYPHCEVCDLKFEREQGYFLGAMYVGYGLALVTIAVTAALLWVITKWLITKVVIWAVVLFVPLAPLIALLSRVLWIYLDWAIDPGQD